MLQLQPHESALLRNAGFRHGFFGRTGGCSRGSFASMNCSYSVGDDAEDVARNLARIARHLGVVTSNLLTVSQVHGCEVYDADSLLGAQTQSAPEADALISAAGDFALSVRTADCVPILVGCRATGMAAAIHAGWRGVASNIVSACIERLLARGATAQSLVAAIGPHIGPQAFEVSPDIARQLDSVAPEANAVLWPPNARPRVRLASLVTSQLHSRGLTSEQIDELVACTYSNDKDFFSYRRDGAKSGRQISAIRPTRLEAL